MQASNPSAMFDSILNNSKVGGEEGVWGEGGRIRPAS